MTAIATGWAALAASSLIVPARASILGSPVLAFLLHGALPLALLAAALAWFTSSVRFCPIMIASAVVGTTLAALGWHAEVAVHLATLGVAVSSFMSANHSPALRNSWEQGALAGAAASGWFTAWAMLLFLPAIPAHDYRAVLLLAVAGAIGFARHTLVVMIRVREVMAAGIEASPYMRKNSWQLMLLLRFLVGAGYAFLSAPLVALGIYAFVRGRS